MHKQPEVTAATRKKLMDSFAELYISTPIEKITISAITKSAGVHRCTFYEYFKDIYDLLEQLENILLEQIKNEFTQIAKKNISLSSKNLTASPDFHSFVRIALSFLMEYGDIFCYLSGSSGDPAFRENLFLIFKPIFIEMHNIPKDSPYADYLAYSVFSLILNNLEYWFKHKASITMEEIIALTYKLTDPSQLHACIEKIEL